MTAAQRFLRRVALAGVLAIAGFFLLTEHRAHLFGVWPFLFLLACPLLHFFGPGHGSGGHGTAEDASDGVKDPAPDAHAGHGLSRGRTS